MTRQAICCRDITAQPFTKLPSKWARRWPELVDASWNPAIGDGVASNIGAGCATPDQVALSVGTSGAMRVILPGTPEIIPDGLFCYRIDENRSLVGGALSNAGSLYEWMRRTLSFESPDTIEAELARMQPDSHGLTVLPFLTPERSPYWDDRLPAALVGLTAATTPLHILRASLESVAFGFWRIAQRLMPLLPGLVTFTAGGAAVEKSPALMQILADVLGHPIAAAPLSEATLRGTALFASGESATQDTAPRVFTPNVDNLTAYLTALSRQERLLNQFRGGAAPIPPQGTYAP